MSKEKFEIVNCKGMQASVTSLGIGIREVGCESIGRKGICLIDVQK